MTSSGSVPGHTQVPIRIGKELARLHAEGKPYRIIGMAWMQGENDAANELSARSYKANLKKLIAAYRADFNRPDMPFVAGQINSLYGDFPEGPAMVRQAFVDVAQADPRVAVIKTKPQPPWDDFPKHDDQVHYNHEGQKRLGTAMGGVHTSSVELNHRSGFGVSACRSRF